MPPIPNMIQAFRLLSLLALWFFTVAPAAAQGSWIDVRRDSARVAFLYAAQLRVYDPGAQAWLPPRTLPRAGATAFAFDGDSAFIAYGRDVFRYGADFANETPFATAPGRVTSLFLDGNLLIVLYTPGFSEERAVIHHRNSGVLLGTSPSWSYASRGNDIAPGINTIFGRSASGSTLATSVRYTDAGQVTGLFSSGSGVPSSSWVRVQPGERRVFDSAGLIYATMDQSLIGSIGGAVRDVGFDGEVSVALRAGVVSGYSRNFKLTGTAPVNNNAQKLHVFGRHAFVFTPATVEGQTPSVEIVGLDRLSAPSAEEPVDPASAEFVPAASWIDGEGVLNLVSRPHMQIFRWSPVTRGWLLPTPLRGPISHAVWHAASERAYLTYQDSRVTRIDPSPAGPVEVPFLDVSGANWIQAIADAGDAIAVNTGVWRSYALDGRFLGSTPNGDHSPLPGWDPVRQRLYHFRDGISPNVLRYRGKLPNGALNDGGSGSSQDTFNAVGPIRVSPDGARIAIGGGAIFSADTMRRVGASTTIRADLQWRGSDLAVLQASGADLTELKLLLNGSVAGPGVQLVGKPRFLHPLDAQRQLAVTIFQDRPRMHIVDWTTGVPVLAFDSIISPPTVQLPPKHVRVDFRSSHTFSVSAAGSPPLAYQWLHTRGGITREIAGADGPQLTLDNIGSDDTGTYSVRVTNAAGSVVSESAMLGAGNLRNPLYSDKQLLVLSRTTLRHYDAALKLMSEREVPLPDDSQVSLPYAMSDVTVDRFGRVHVLIRRQSYGPGLQGYIATYDREFDLWFYSPVYGERVIAPSARGELSATRDWLVCESALINLIDFSSHPWPKPEGNTPVQCSTDLNGNILAATSNGRVYVLNPETFAIIRMKNFGRGLDAVAADANSTLYAVDYEGNFGQINLFSTAPVWTAPMEGAGEFTDISISSEGRVAVGSRNGKVWVTGRTFTGGALLEIPNPGITSYTAWTTRVDSPRPTAPTHFPKTVLEDELVDHHFNFQHADPHARITVTGPLPTWLKHEPGGILKGTPLQRDVGTFTLLLSVRDQFNGTLLYIAPSEVIEVNDTPVSIPGAIAGNEDEGPFQIELTSLFEDEETPSANLVYAIVDAGDTTWLTSVIQGTRLVVNPRLDAFGETVVTVEATDAGGLTARSEILVTIHPVNDPPVFVTPLANLDAGPAATDRTLDLTSNVFDADPGDLLTWRLSKTTNPAIFSHLVLDPVSGRLDMKFAPYVSGSSSVTVVVTDQAGTSAESTFQVLLPALPLPELVMETKSTLNRQTGVLEQRITVTNSAARAIGGFDLAISGLGEGWTVNNGSGQIGGIWEVHHRQPLAAGASVTLILEYYSPNRSPAVIPVVSASLTTVPEVDPVATLPGLAVDRCEALEDGLLIEFTATPGKLYEVQYSDDAQVWKVSPIHIRAAGNRVQWIDRGPPRTDSPPGEKPSRFYRVLEK